MGKPALKYCCLLMIICLFVNVSAQSVDDLSAGIVVVDGKMKYTVYGKSSANDGAIVAGAMAMSLS